MKLNLKNLGYLLLDALEIVTYRRLYTVITETHLSFLPYDPIGIFCLHPHLIRYSN